MDVEKNNHSNHNNEMSLTHTLSAAMHQKEVSKKVQASKRNNTTIPGQRYTKHVETPGFSQTTNQSSELQVLKPMICYHGLYPRG